MMNEKKLYELIDTAKEKIEKYHQHSIGRINFWTTIPSYDNSYVICVENARNELSAINTRDVLILDAEKYSYDDYVEVIDKLHELYSDIPFLFHELPKAKLNDLRDKYGSFYVRDDIVVNERR